MSEGRILAYLDRWSVRAGEDLAVCVSCEHAGRFEAELVRVVQGDRNPQGPGFRAVPVEVDLGGPFAGRRQAIEPGSLARVEDHSRLSGLASFTVSMAVRPTSPGRGPQTLAARRDPATGYGFELHLDRDGVLAVEIAGPPGRVLARLDHALIPGHWYRVGASYDADGGDLVLEQRPATVAPGCEEPARRVFDAPRALRQDVLAGALTFAARDDADRALRRHYNGRIDGPVLLATSTSMPATPREGNDEAVVASWDFSLDIPSTRIVDVSGHGLHGRLHNLPTRGVAGIDWSGDCHAWPHDASGYGAIHFHDDDLYDAGWEESFRFTIPAALPSGVYALKLYTDDDVFYTPFAVRPAAGRRCRDVVFVLPTASYMAYANNRIGLDVPETELVCGRLIEMTMADRFMQCHPELGLSFYDLHSDGSGVYYSSRLRPVVDMQPGWIGKLGGAGSNVWQFNADTHILGWLEHNAIGFDVITDEDLHHEGAGALDGARVVLTGTHPEYCSASMLDAYDDFLEGGGRLMYLGGNGFYWRVSFHPDLPGVIECRKSEDGIRAFAPEPGEYYASFTGEYTGLWRRNGRAPNRLTGVGMVAQGFDRSSPYRRTAESRGPRVDFIFQGIEAEVIGDSGLSGGGAAGIEIDAASVAQGTPPHAVVLARSECHTDLYLMTPEDMLDPVPGLGGSEAGIIRAEMTFFESPAGGAVFSTGSIAWAGAMAHAGYENDVARLTANVLRRFLDPEPFVVTG